MKKIMSALVVAGVMALGCGVYANEGAKPAQKAEKQAEKADKYLALLKDLDANKYAEINAMTDAKAKATAAKNAVIDIKLAELQKSNKAKYDEIEALKTSDPKKYAAEVNKLISAGKKK